MAAALVATVLGVVGAAAAAHRAPAASACARSTFRGVSALPANAASPGLHERDDPVAYYRVFGSSPDQIRAGLDACRPDVGASEGDGYTSWNFTWAIAWDGACRVSRVAVSLHIGMALPSWTAGRAGDSGIAGLWARYTAALKTHEQGHVTIARTYARKLLTDLRHLPGGDCSTLLQTATNVANADMSAAQAANDAYDARTDHGATQGATFP